MKKISILSVLIICCSISFCQKVGIGTTSPETTLHILSATDSTQLTLESSTPLAAGKSMGMIFKKGNYYVAGIRSTGISASAARLGFFTMSPGFGPAEMTERVSIFNNGNVGIGTITPSTLLHVGNYNGNKTTALTISTEGAYFSTIGDRYAVLKLRHSTDKYGFSMESYDGPTTAGLSFKTHNADSTGVTRMYIDRNSGNVGIGTTSPVSKLDLRSGNVDESITLNIGNSDQSHQILLFGGRQNDPNPFIAAKAGDPLRFANLGANFNEWMRITPTGNVGIGFTNPTSKLAVNGTSYFLNTTEASSPAVNGVSTVDNRFAPGVAGTGVNIGVVANSNTVSGIGLFGYNNFNNVAISYINGAGVNGFSSGGHGVAGVTTKVASAAIFGNSSTSGAYGGQFTGSGGALALLSSGPVRFTGIGESLGKVLTSDASGNATWQTPSTTGTPNNISFSAHLTNSIDVGSGNINSFSGLTTDYQFGSAFNSTVGVFIAPADGIYQFTFSICFLVRDNNPIYSAVALKINGITAVGGEFNDITPSFNSPNYKTLTYTKTMNLSVGTNVYMTYRLTQAGANSIAVSGNNEPTSSFFSGIKLQ